MARSVYKYRIDLSGKEKQLLRQAKKKGRKDARLVLRILMILLAHKGKTISETAETLDCCEQTVLNQRKRFLDRRAEGPVQALEDRPRSGRGIAANAPRRGSTAPLRCSQAGRAARERFDAGSRGRRPRRGRRGGWPPRKRNGRMPATHVHSGEAGGAGPGEAGPPNKVGRPRGRREQGRPRCPGGRQRAASTCPSPGSAPPFARAGGSRPRQRRPTAARR